MPTEETPPARTGGKSRDLLGVETSLGQVVDIREALDRRTTSRQHTLLRIGALRLHASLYLDGTGNARDAWLAAQLRDFADLLEADLRRGEIG